MVGREGGAASPGPSQTCPSRWGCGGMGGGERRRMPKRRTVPASIPPPPPPPPVPSSDSPCGTERYRLRVEARLDSEATLGPIPWARAM